MPATINGTTGFGGNLTGNVTGNVAGTSSAVADGAVSAAKLDSAGQGAGNPPVYGCRAWVRFDATLDSFGTVSTANTNRRIIASGNVSSVLRTTAGQYTVTFATAMPSSDYSAVVSTRHATGASYASNADSHTLTAATLVINTGWQHPTNGGTLFDPTSVNLSVFA